jgi:hypothetical protein
MRNGAVNRVEWDALVKDMTGPGMLQDIDAELSRCAEWAKERIQADTPVKTGRLKYSFNAVRIKIADWFVGSHLYYAAAVEFMNPRGKMVAKNLIAIQEYVASRIRELVERKTARH